MGHPQQPDPYQQQPGQQMPPGQPYPGQPYPGQQMPGQPYPGQQPQFGQPPQYGQQFPPGQPQFGGQGGGYGQPPRPPKSNGGKIALIVGGAAVVLIALGVGAFFLFNGGSSAIGGGYDDPRDLAQAWVDQEGDPKDMVCQADLDEIEKFEQENPARPTDLPTSMPKPEVSLKSVDVASGSDSGTFTMKMTMDILGSETTTTSTYDLVEEDGGWKVCGILDPDIEVDSDGPGF